MRVTAINYQNNFKGLWGETIKTKERRQSDSKLILSNYETKIYYPFGDESIEDVNRVLRTNSTYQKLTENRSDNMYIKEIGTDISIKERLYFSAKQWLKYISNKLAVGSAEYNLIEQNLKNLHLEKYIRVL